MSDSAPRVSETKSGIVYEYIQYIMQLSCVNYCNLHVSRLINTSHLIHTYYVRISLST